MDQKEYAVAKEIFLKILETQPNFITGRVPTAQHGSDLANFMWGFIETHVELKKQVQG